MGNVKNKLKNYAVEIKATTTCSREIVGRKKGPFPSGGNSMLYW
jgi:hypothetical protein